MGAEGFGAVLCPILALEVGPMFQAQEQAREKTGIKHMEEETFVQACLCFLTGDIMHHGWIFDISCYDVDFTCAPSCLPLLPSVHVPSRASWTCCVQCDPGGSLHQARNQLWRHRRLTFKTVPSAQDDPFP